MWCMIDFVCSMFTGCDESHATVYALEFIFVENLMVCVTITYFVERFVAVHFSTLKVVPALMFLNAM